MKSSFFNETLNFLRKILRRKFSVSLKKDYIFQVDLRFSLINILYIYIYIYIDISGMRVFNTVKNDFQNRLKNDTRPIQPSKKVFVFADKTRNIYEMEKHITKNY